MQYYLMDESREMIREKCKTLTSPVAPLMIVVVDSSAACLLYEICRGHHGKHLALASD